jgi:bifunctional lysine-specific demethylase and histidyl-hydroxylase NO66
VVQPFTLDWLLRPVPVTAFFGSYWETTPLLVSRENPDYFASLPGLDAVDELITATTSSAVRSAGDGRIVRTDPGGVASERSIRLGANGIPDIQDVYRAYHNGYTIIVNQLHRRSAAVALLCRVLENSLHHQIGTNLYLTPRGGQGFPPHVDNHDVLILQLHGVKEWHVFRPSDDLPLAAGKHGPAESAGDFREFTLRPGDVLYLPRGFPHEAVTAASPSLHLTVGIHVYRWMDLMVEAVRLLADEQVSLRAALPPGFLGDPLDAAHATKLANDLALAMADASLVDRAKARLGASLLEAGKAAAGGHFRSLDAIAGLTGESIVARAPGVLCRVRSTPGEALIEFATNYVSGPLLLEPTLRFIAEHERFAVFELPGELTTEDKLDLVGRLVSEGLLICPDESYGGEL